MLYTLFSRRDVPLQKCSSGNIKRPTDAFKREKHADLAAVEGATCNLQEKSRSQERVSSDQFSIRQKIDVTVGKNQIGEFCPSYSGDVQHLATGKPITPIHKVPAQAPAIVNLQSLTPVQRFGSTTLHLYLPTASCEEEEPNITRDKNEATKNKDSRSPRNILKVDPLKPLVPSSSRRMSAKRTHVPCKEALSTANLSVQFCGDEKGLYSTPLRRSLIDNTRNHFIKGDNNSLRNPIQRPVSNVGYRLGSYNSDKAAESSEYGLSVSTLKLSDDKPKGSYMLTQRRGPDKMDSFFRSKKDHEMNEEQSSTCRSQSEMLDFETRNTYI
ncbi:uncharacterized protein [Engystomops pustulosus]|uniref:uncharacterized protein n=1 Tax=Engystomops pustulosus TaxID=76066 RepID=UPI003AFA2866